MNDLAGALEGRAAGGVVAHAGAADALLILLVALGAGLLVAVDKLHEIGGEAVQFGVAEGLG